jgi:DNA-directed RNA polymerase specialized sigma24 family protein
LSFAEIGQQMGQTEGAVRSKHHRAVCDLRDCLDPDSSAKLRAPRTAPP